MTVAVYYFSRSGNTRKLADAIARAVGTEARDVTKQPLEEKADILFLGGALYAWNVDPAIRVFLEGNRDRIGTAVNFGTSASGRATYKKMKELTDKNGVTLCEEHFVCPGHFLMLHKDRPNEADCQAAAEFAKRVCEKFE